MPRMPAYREKTVVDVDLIHNGFTIMIPELMYMHRFNNLKHLDEIWNSLRTVEEISWLTGPGGYPNHLRKSNSGEIIQLPANFFSGEVVKRKQLRQLRARVFEKTGVWIDSLEDIERMVAKIAAKETHGKFRVVKTPNNPAKTTKKKSRVMRRNPDHIFASFVIAGCEDGFIAATTRAKDRGEQGRIGLPGGKVDPGEDPKQTAIREAAEEGWDIHGSLIHVIDQQVEGRIVRWYLASDYATERRIYKEQKRITPIRATVEEIMASGYGNDHPKVGDALIEAAFVNAIFGETTKQRDARFKKEIFDEWWDHFSGTKVIPFLGKERPHERRQRGPDGRLYRVFYYHDGGLAGWSLSEGD